MGLTCSPWQKYVGRPQGAEGIALWNDFVDHCEKCGLNMIIMDVGEGVQWESHPELAIKGSWSKELVKSEALRLREKGIELIPKLNFSKTHDAWLGVYSRMVSTPEYYKVTKELIEEVYEIFLHPSIVHIGMDEENWKHATDGSRSVIALRSSALQVDDTNYFIECVENLGATCHMWHAPYCNVKEEDAERIKKSVIPEVWMYYSYLKENWTLISQQDDEVKDFYANEFVRRYGYTIEYVDGMIGAPWGGMLPERRELLWEAVELVGRARKQAEDIMQNA